MNRSEEALARILCCDNCNRAGWLALGITLVLFIQSLMFAAWFTAVNIHPETLGWATARAVAAPVKLVTDTAKAVGKPHSPQGADATSKSCK